MLDAEVESEVWVEGVDGGVDGVTKEILLGLGVTGIGGVLM
jgi:hypothetical protein